MEFQSPISSFVVKSCLRSFYLSSRLSTRTSTRYPLSYWIDSSGSWSWWSYWVSASYDSQKNYPSQPHCQLLISSFNLPQQQPLFFFLPSYFQVPLCFLRRLDSLRHTSYLSLLAVLFLVLTVIYYSLFPSARKELPKHSKGSIEFIRIDYHLIAIFPVFVFAYTCAQNVFPVYNELKDNSEKEVNKVILRSISGGGTIYLVSGWVNQSMLFGWTFSFCRKELMIFFWESTTPSRVFLPDLISVSLFLQTDRWDSRLSHVWKQDSG